MEETTHDSSSSSSRKSEEKCPPAGGIKMKIGGFKTGHCYHKPSDAAIQHEPSGVSSGVWLPRLSQDDFDRVVQTTPSGLLAVSDVYSCAHVAHSRNNSHKSLRQLNSPKNALYINKPVNILAQRHSCHII